MSSLYPDLNDPERARKIGRAAGDLERYLLNRKLESAEKERSLTERGQDLELTRARLAEEGASARHLLQYGPEGTEMTEIASERPYYEAAAKKLGIEGSIGQFNLDVANANKPARIAAEGSQLAAEPIFTGKKVAESEYNTAEINKLLEELKKPKINPAAMTWGQVPWYKEFKESGAKPGTIAAPSFFDIDAEMSEANRNWKPTGTELLDWPLRRGKNVLAAPFRAIGAGLYGASNLGSWR